MRSTLIVLSLLLLPAFVIAQSDREIFTLKKQVAFADKNAEVIQTVPVDSGRRLLVIGKQQVQLWSAPDATMIASSPHQIPTSSDLGRLVRLISFPSNVTLPFNMRVSTDGSKGMTIAKVADAGSKNKVEAAVVWDLRTGRSLGSLSRGAGAVRESEFSWDGSTIMTVHGDLKDAEIAFWDAGTLSHTRSIRVQDLSFYHMSHDGDRVFIGRGKANKWVGVTVMSYEPSKTIELWNTKTGSVEKVFAPRDGSLLEYIDSNPIVSSDQKYLAVQNSTNGILVWDTTGDGAPKYEIGDAGSKERVRLVGISKDSRYLMAAKADEALVYDLKSGDLFRKFPMKKGNSYTLSPDSRYAVVRAKGSVGIYDLEKEKAVFHIALETQDRRYEDQPNYKPDDELYEIERPTLSPDGKFLMIHGYKTVRIYDVASGGLVQTLTDPLRAKYDGKGKLKDSGLQYGKIGWLSSGDSIYVVGADGKSLYFWNKK